MAHIWITFYNKKGKLLREKQAAQYQPSKHGMPKGSICFTGDVAMKEVENHMASIVDGTVRINGKLCFTLTQAERAINIARISIAQESSSNG